MALEQLLSILGAEQRLVERLHDDDGVRTDLHTAELHRAVTVYGLAHALGLPDDVNLTQLIARVPAPWREVLEQHRRALAADGSRRLPPSLADFLR